MPFESKRFSPHLFFFLSCLFLLASPAVKASVFDIFYKMNIGTTLNPPSVGIEPPGNYPYSAIAPVSGTNWNVLDRNTLIPANTPQSVLTLYSPNNQAVGGLVADSASNVLSGVSLTINYTSRSKSVV